MKRDSAETESPPSGNETVRLLLKTMIKTDEAVMVDLGAAKVWISNDDVKSYRRIREGVYEIEVPAKVIKAKREEIRKLKEEATGVKGSVLGEVTEAEGRLLKESGVSYWIEVGGREVCLPKVCFAELVKLDGDRYRFVLQKDFFEFKLRQAESASCEQEIRVEVEIARETDRAYLLNFEGNEFWYPKREILEKKEIGEGRWNLLVPGDFWNFKLQSAD